MVECGADGTRAVLRRNPKFDALAAEAAAHWQAGRAAEAEAAYLAALAVTPGHSAIVHNLGVLAARRGDHQTAIERFDTAIASEPNYASAHYNRAVSCVAAGRPEEAIAGFARASALEPGHYASHRALAFLLLAAGDRDRALDHFARTYELRRGGDRSNMAQKSLNFANRTKLHHDAEQLHYLAGRRRDGARYGTLARTYEAVARHFPVMITRISPDDFELLGESYNTGMNIADAPEIATGTLSHRPDRDALVRRFQEGTTSVVTFDNLLTAPALVALRRYLLESTIWHDFAHIDGFVAAYLEDGLACPLVLQIVDELRRTFPELLGPHPLSQAWAFKAVDPTAAVDVHADDGAISLNFWVTPTEANRNTARGGMTLWCVMPPSDWTLSGYDADRERAVTFLERHADKRLVVPYRENRAVLFNSRLLHASDAPDFAKGYENHRINVTLLFGTSADR